MASTRVSIRVGIKVYEAFPERRGDHHGRASSLFAVPAHEPAGEPFLRVVRRPADERRATRYTPRPRPSPGQARLAREARTCGQGAGGGRSGPGRRGWCVLVTTQDWSRRPAVDARRRKHWLRLAWLSPQPEPGRGSHPDGGFPQPGLRATRGPILCHHGVNRWAKVERHLPTLLDRPVTTEAGGYATVRRCQRVRPRRGHAPPWRQGADLWSAQESHRAGHLGRRS